MSSEQPVIIDIHSHVWAFPEHFSEDFRAQGRRAKAGVEEELATRMGTSHSAISRIESGQHSTSVQTLQRLAAALEMRFVMGFEHGPVERPTRELVSA